MANNYIRYKYFLVSRDAYTELYTQIKNIVGSSTMKASIIMYLSEPIGVDIPIQSTFTTTADVATLSLTETLLASVLKGKMHITFHDGVHTNIESKSELFGKLQSHFASGIDTNLNMSGELQLRSGALVNLHIWYGGMNIKHHIPVQSTSKLDWAIDTKVELTNLVTVVSTAELGQPLKIKITSEINSDVAVYANARESINSKPQLDSILTLETSTKNDSTIKTIVLSNSSCIQICIPSMYKYIILSEMDSNTLSNYDDVMLSELDFIEIQL